MLINENLDSTCLCLFIYLFKKTETDKVQGIAFFLVTLSSLGEVKKKKLTVVAHYNTEVNIVPLQYSRTFS